MGGVCKENDEQSRLGDHEGGAAQYSLNTHISHITIIIS